MTEWRQEFFLSGWYTLLEDIPPERTAAQVDFVAEALELQAGARVLDVACGIGRHSLLLAARGMDVTGLDYTPAYLQRASGGATGLPARFLRGDMRRLPFREAQFDAALNLFTSWGYFEDDEENARVLREIARALRPGGLFLLDTIHRDGLVRRFREKDWHLLPDGWLLEERAWDARNGRPLSTWTFLRGGEQRSFTLSNRAYTCSEVEQMMRAAGLSIVEVWGDWEGGPLGLDSIRLIVKARK
jgi:SAM-dependent methyltransferase